jgi:hypothetical protein
MLAHLIASVGISLIIFDALSVVAFIIYDASLTCVPGRVGRAST